MAANVLNSDNGPPRTIQSEPIPPVTMQRDPSSPTTLARRERNRSTLVHRLMRKELGLGIHIIYQGADTELFWSTLDELRQAPLPFLDEIKDPQIRDCIRYLKGKKYVIIPPKASFNPESILAGSSKTRRKKKKRKKGGAVRTRRS